MAGSRGEEADEEGGVEGIVAKAISGGGAGGDVAEGVSTEEAGVGKTCEEADEGTCVEGVVEGDVEGTAEAAGVLVG